MKSSLAKLALGAALLSVACRDNAANARAKADSDLARDLALAGPKPQQPTTFKDTTVAQAPTTRSALPQAGGPCTRPQTRRAQTDSSAGRPGARAAAGGNSASRSLQRRRRRRFTPRSAPAPPRA